MAGTVKEKNMGLVMAHNILELQLAGILWEWGDIKFYSKMEVTRSILSFCVLKVAVSSPLV